jgi:sec-independent protein translocase protein TatB
MFDIGVSKLMIVGGIALIVIGPERLPRVARMVGTMLGRAQRYVADVKAEVNRSIELEELQKMKTQFESAAREVHDSVQRGVEEARSGMDDARSDIERALAGEAGASSSGVADWQMASPSVYKPPRKNWRLKRGAMPLWYKRREGVRTHAQSGAARVARFRPAGRGRPL